MFFGKKKEEPLVSLDYTHWESELGFLNLVISRKQNASREFLIGVYDSQKATTDYLSDEEIDPVIGRIVIDVLEQLSENYKKFLINKYFGSKEALVRYITEEVYVSTVSDAVNRNYNKSTANLKNRAAEILSKNLNK